MYLKSILTKTLMTLCAVVALHPLASETLGQGCSCSSGTITCTGTITASDFTTLSRAGTNGGTCATPVACASSGFAGPFHFRATAFTNTIAGTTCYTVNLANNSCAQSIVSYAYLTTYNAASGQECTNYLADNALGVASGGNDSFSFNLTLNQRVVIVVLDRTASGNCAGGTYTLTISHTGASATTCPGTPTLSDGVVTGTITARDGAPLAGVVMNLSGTQSRKTITDANGNYKFDNVETNGFYTVTPSRANYTFNPAQSSFSQLGNRTDAAFTATSTGDRSNPLDTAEYFVRQQYVDILGREPDEGGFNYWSDQINQCNGDADCIRSRRMAVATAFFIEAEFKQTGLFIYDVYSGTLGRRPAFAEYSTDREQVVGGPNLDAEKSAFIQSFVQRDEFKQAYPDSLTNEEFVNKLYDTAGLFPYTVERQIEIIRLGNGAARSDVVRDLTNDDQFTSAQYNKAFVLTEYFGYLQRNPDPGGYDFWLNVISNREVGNYRGMVCAFITSTEYQERFSSVITHSNGECGP